MKVGWLHDDPGYVGGAELTMAEFKTAAPEGVEILEIPPGGAVPDCDEYVIGNCTQYAERPSGIRYLHDMRGGFTSEDKLIFCSPLQRGRYEADGEVVPPALDLKRFKPTRQVKRNGTRKGAVSVGQWRNPGKGQQHLREWSAHTLLTLYGGGSFVPFGPNIDYRGELRLDQVPQILWAAETFVHLPTDVEPFGRAVVEAWAAGCEIVTNNLVGARHFIETDPEALETASEDFWGVVTG